VIIRWDGGERIYLKCLGVRSRNRIRISTLPRNGAHQSRRTAEILMEYYASGGLIPQRPGIVCAVGGGIEGGPAVES